MNLVQLVLWPQLWLDCKAWVMTLTLGRWKALPVLGWT